MIHIQMDEAINDGKFKAWFVLTDNDFEGSYNHFIDMIDGDIDLDDEDLMNIKIELAINSGDLIDTSSRVSETKSNLENSPGRPPLRITSRKLTWAT